MSDPGLNTDVEDELTLQPLNSGGSAQRKSLTRRGLRKELKQTIRKMGVKKSNLSAKRALPGFSTVAQKSNVSSIEKKLNEDDSSTCIQQGCLAFYLCEKCGNRLYETDLQSGAAKNKQYRGIFCAVCSIGVTTVEIEPLLSQAEQTKSNRISDRLKSPSSSDTKIRIKPPSKRQSSSRVNARPESAGRAAIKSSESLENTSVVHYAIGGAALLMVCLFLLTFGGKKTPKEETPIRVVVKDEYNSPPPPTDVPVKTETPTVIVTEEAAPKVETSKVEVAVAADRLVNAETTATPSTQLPDEVSATPAPTEEVLGNKVSPGKLKSGEDEEVIDNGPKKNAPVPKNEPSKPGSKPAMEVDGDEKKLTGVLGGLLEKKVDPAAPAAPPPVAKRLPFSNAVGKQPSIINDASRLSGIERETCTMLQNIAPGWWCRDYSNENSEFNISLHGKDKVIKLNPPNDVIGSKIVGTLDIPAGYNAILRFEVASFDEKSFWNLMVRVNGYEIIPKQLIHNKSQSDWQEIIVPLGALSGKQFDIQIEGWSVVKNPKLFKKQFVYIRNPRLDWPGKK